MKRRSSQQVDLFEGRVSSVRPPTIRAFLSDDELIVDNFAGGGGASSGIGAAIGRDPDIAINHDAEAIAMHAANHPTTKHYTESVWQVDPVKACGGRPVALAWFSPDCKDHSKAKGGKPRNQKIRALAWVAVRWAQLVAPRVIALENVEEFQDWGPVVDGARDPKRKGQTFRAFVRKLERLGYVVDWRLLRACDYGAPTTRRRLFLVARNDGRAIRWPEPTHGPRRAAPHRTAAECIDWSIPCPSIFDRERPLADKTMARIARGIRKFVLESARPFIVRTSMHLSNAGCVYDMAEPLRTITTDGGLALVSPMIVKAKSYSGGGNDAMPADEPLRTVTASKRGEFAVVSPVLVSVNHGGDSPGDRARRLHDPALPLPTVAASGGQYALAIPYLVHRSNGERPGQAPRIYDVEAPLGTIVAQGQKHALCAAFLARHYGERPTGGWNGGAAADVPLSAVTATNHHSLVAANLVRYNGDQPGAERVADIAEPLGTQDTSRRYALVASFLARYNGTSTGQDVRDPLSTVDTRDRFGLVTVTIDGEPYVIVDIGMRMLTPRELFRAQGFTDDYRIDPIGPKGKPLTKTAQIRMCGNSVAPPMATAIARANLEAA